MVPAQTGEEGAMLTAIVTFPLPEGLGPEEARALYEASRPRYQGVPGLVPKYYLFRPGQGGGVYLWADRASGEACHDPGWRGSIRERFGAEPEIRWFDTPVIVENAPAG
jgi:hypothetical protein